MRIGRLMLGLIFLFNPTVRAIDILPDFIGYILILSGMARLSDLDDYVWKARKKFKTLAIVASFEFVAMLLSFLWDSTWRLIGAFTFSTLTLIYAIPAFVSLFAGISYLELRMTDHREKGGARAEPRHGGVFDKTELDSGTAYFEVYEKVEGGDDAAFFADVSLPDGKRRIGISDAGFSTRGRSETAIYESDEARVSCIVFILVRAICSCLPEFTAIFGTKNGYTSASATAFSGVHAVLCVIFGGISLVFGILWLSRMMRYFNGFRRDTAFLSALEKRYEAEILSDTLLLTKRKTRLFGRLCVIALVFMLSMPLDGITVAYETLSSFYFMPEFLWGALMAAAFFATRDFLPSWKTAVRNALLFIPFSVISYVALIFYSLKCAGYAFPYQEAGFLPIYLTYMGAFLLSMALFAVTIPQKKRAYLSMADKAATLFSSGLHEMAERKKAEAYSEMSRKISRVMTAETVYVGVSILCLAAVPFANESILFGLSWLIRLVFGVGLVIGEAGIQSELRYNLERVM